MVITFLFGNGFDVNLGLKTRYTDFYPTYIDACKQLPDDHCIKFFSKQIEDNYENWSDFELSFAKKAKGTHTEIGTIIANFNNLFSEYLKSQCNKCDFKTSDIKGKFRNFILKPYSYLERRDIQLFETYYNLHNNESRTYNFISFNYTDTLDKLIDLEMKTNIPTHSDLHGTTYAAKIASPLHLHGSLNDEYIIVAIDSLEQFEDETMQKNQRLARHCVKRTINEQNGFSNKESEYIQMIQSSNILCIYGFSFGETDKSRWTIIYDWLKKKKENKLIIFKYDSGINALNHMSKGLLLDKIDELRDEYLSILGFEENEFSAMYNQIFVTDSSNALNFKLITELEEESA